MSTSVSALPLEPEAASPLKSRGTRFRVGRWLAPSLLLVLFVASLAAPLWAPHHPNAESLTARLLPPVWDAHGSSHYLLGTDELGRDMLSRLIYGASDSFTVGVAAASIAAVLGTFVGIIAGYAGGWFGWLIRRMIDIETAFPFLVIALTIVAVFGASVSSLIITIAVWTWVPFARLAHARTLVLKEADFVRAVVAMGAGTPRIITRHLLPNLAPPMIVLWTFVVALSILIEAALSFLGVGVPPPTATWGSMLSAGQDYLQTAWWISVFPAVAIVGTIVLINVTGTWLSSRFEAPSSR